MTVPLVAVDARVELLGAAFLLAGAPEYTAAYDTPYRRAICAGLAAHATHPLIEASRRLRVEHGVSHDAPLALAVQLDAELRVPAGATLDPRWSGVELEPYLAALRDFARRSDHAGLLRAQADYLAGTERRFRRVADAQLVPWFEALFARPPARCTIVPGLLTGPMSYGLRSATGDGVDVRLVMSLERIDRAGWPRPGALTRELLAHELAHAYVNPTIVAHLPALEGAFARAYERVREDMSRRSYPTLGIVLAEAVVRAVTLLYVQDRFGATAAARSVRAHQERGFAWTADLARALDEQRRRGPLSEEVLVASIREVFAGLTVETRRP